MISNVSVSLCVFWAVEGFASFGPRGCASIVWGVFRVVKESCRNGYAPTGLLLRNSS